MGLLILSKCDSHNNSWLLQFQYKKLKIKKVKAFTEENKQTDKQMIKLKLTAVVYIYNSLNSFNPNSDQHLISLYLITAKSFIKTMRIKKMITTLQLLHIFFLSIPNKRYREEYKECGHWCWGLNKWQRTFVRERCSLFCHEQGTKEKKFWVPMRSITPQTFRFCAPMLCGEQDPLQRPYMTCALHTFKISNVNSVMFGKQNMKMVSLSLVKK